MAKVNDLMLDALNKAFKAAEQISDPVARAQTYTGLVHACVAAIKTKEPVGGTEEKEPVSGTESKPTEKKEPIKGTEGKKEVPKAGNEKKSVEEAKKEPPKGEEEKEPVKGDSEKEPVSGTKKEEPNNDTKTEPKAGTEENEPPKGNDEEEDDDDWTPRMMDKYQTEIASLNKVYKYFVKQDQVDTFKKALEECTEGNMHTIQDVTPACVQMVVAFFKDWFQKQKTI